MTVRLLQISDTHLSPGRPYFVPNAERLAAAIGALAPDLVVNTGDISLDGADSDADLAFAVGFHRGLGVEALLLPGNHDVGDFPTLGGRQPANAERLARWRRLVGADRFVRDVPGWRLIGIDSQILGGGLPEEAEQWDALAEALGGAGGRRVALFLHKPLCLESLAATDVTYWPVLEPERGRLAAMLAAAPIGFVASGHIHQWRDREADGLRQIWAPAVSFIVGGHGQAVFGRKVVGAVEHLLHADGRFESRLVDVPGLEALDISTMRHVYGGGQVDAAAE
jgi:Icc protein